MATQSAQASPPLAEEKIKELIEASQDAKSRAYAPYSNFHVGAALLTTEGRVFKGAQVVVEVWAWSVIPAPPAPRPQGRGWDNLKLQTVITLQLSQWQQQSSSQ